MVLCQYLSIFAGLFCRMESREKCEQIISIFNNRALPGSQQPLVVKFADGGEIRKKLQFHGLLRSFLIFFASFPALFALLCIVP